MKSHARLGLGQVFWLSAALTGALWVTLPSSARAEVIVTGTSKDARIEISDATLEQLLSALREKLDLAYSSSAPLDHKVQDGTFAGPLSKILTPLLTGYDHVMKMHGEHISLVLTAQQKPSVIPNSAVAAAAPASAPLAGTASDAGSADASDKNKGTTDSKKQNVVSPNGPAVVATPPSSSPPPSPFAVTTFLETQTAPFMNQGSTPNKTSPASQGTLGDPSPQAQQQQSQQASQFAAQQAAIAQTTQRANVALQSLVGALGRLPK
jgi:hypothetical protein